MVKIRIALLSLTLIVVGSVVWFVSLYARGYRFDQETNTLTPSGLLVIKSDPDGAQVFINGELKTATNATTNLPPDTYDISIKKEGYLEWKKRLTIEKEVVTETTAHIFKSAPSLSAITFSGAINPVPSDDMSKIAYGVPTKKNDNTHNSENAGLWIIETINLPIGFSRDPRRIADGDLSEADWKWSPNGREILLTTNLGSYLLDADTFTPQNQKVNIATTIDELEAEWKLEREQKLNSKVRRLPDELAKIFENKVSSAVFSPDNDMVLYTASSSATVPDELIKPVPGASTQKQERELKPNKAYVYDIKEDRNFLIDENSENNLLVGSGELGEYKRRLTWFPTSRHLVLSEDNKITIMDYDNTNRQKVYEGNYEGPHAYPSVNINRLLILTNLGSDSSPTNLYSLSLK